MNGQHTVLSMITETTEILKKTRITIAK